MAPVQYDGLADEGPGLGDSVVPVVGKVLAIYRLVLRAPVPDEKTGSDEKRDRESFFLHDATALQANGGGGTGLSGA
jgi:hypothetical protein